MLQADGQQREGMDYLQKKLMKFHFYGREMCLKVGLGRSCVNS